MQRAAKATRWHYVFEEQGDESHSSPSFLTQIKLCSLIMFPSDQDCNQFPRGSNKHPMKTNIMWLSKNTYVLK